MAVHRVIVVDDNPLFLASASRLIGSFPGFEVVGKCSSASDGISLTAKLHPDVVLMDVAMPEMDGLTASLLFSEQPWRPSVVLMTVNDPPFYQAAAQRARAHCVIGKSELGVELEPTLLGLLSNRGDESTKID